MNELQISKINSGGIITNYYCSSKCRHCLYGCSPSWKKNYINPETAKSLFKKIHELDCNSVHIGGGEPLLNIEALKEFLESAISENIKVEYLETNSSWFKELTISIFLSREETSPLLMILAEEIIIRSSFMLI